MSLDSHLSKVVVCEYCGSTLILKDGALDPTGRKAKLAQYPSRFAVGRKGTIKGSPFRVLGRVRYDYGDGFWDEWFLVFDDGRTAYLQEDEGEYTLFVKKRLTSAVPPWEELHAGSRFRAGEYEVFVNEKGSATISGGEGQIGWRFLPGDTLKYIDGIGGGKVISIEYAGDEIDMSVGDSLDYDDVSVE